VNVEIEDIQTPKYHGQDLTYKHLLVARSGGAGDIMMIAPALLKLRKLYPTCKITFVTDQRFTDIVKMLAVADHIGIWPIPESAFKNYDYYATFEKTIEGPNKDARTLHGVELFAKILGVTLDEEDTKVAPLYIGMKHKISVNEMLEKLDILTLAKYGVKRRKYVVIQFRSSGLKRSFDPGKLVEVIAKLTILDMDVFIVGGVKPVKLEDGKIGLQKDCPVDFMIEDEAGNKGPHPRVHNMCGELKWPETAALIASADLVISADSSCLHIAGSLNVPCLGIYGPFPPELRTKYYPKCTVIKAEAECAPCFAHGSKPCSHFNKERACSGCWDSVSVDSIVELAQTIVRGENESK
jgi:ADP-heptose:LPS heptosyltransferase